MNLFKYLLLTLFFLALFSKNAFSAIGYNHNSIYIFGALDLAYSRLNSNVVGEAANKEGYMWGGRFLGNYTYNRLSINTGFGYFMNRYESEFINNLKVRLTTKTIFLELNPMYKFTNRHYAGILWRQDLGAGLLVAPSTINNSSRPQVQTRKIVGINYYYSIPWKSWKMRLGVQVMKPIDIGDRSGIIGMFTVQLGLPVIKNLRQSLIRKKRVKKSVLNLILKKQYINFKTDSADLDKKSEKFIRELGKFLAQHPNWWSNFSIEGHTDSVGSANYNKGLSIERARTVAYELVKVGASQTKIFFEGYGEERPLDKNETKEAYKQNRRVEMHFVGNTNANKIKKFFDKH